MKVQAKSELPRKRVPEGDHIAVVVGYTDLGTQPGFHPSDEPRRRVRLTVEIPSKRITFNDRDTGEIKEGPMRLSTKPLTLALGIPGPKQSALAQWIQALGIPIPKSTKGNRTIWDPAFAVDLGDLIGRSCWIVVGTSKSGYDEITEVRKLGPNDPPAKLESEPETYDCIDEDKRFIMPPSKLPDFVKDWILDSSEARVARGEKPHVAVEKDATQKPSPRPGIDPDDVPF